MLPLRRVLEIQRLRMAGGTHSEVPTGFPRAARFRVWEAPAWAVRRPQVQHLGGIRSWEATDSEEPRLVRGSVIAGSVASEDLAADGAADMVGEDVGTAAGAASVGVGVLAGVTRDGFTPACPGAVTGTLTGTIRGGAGIIMISDTTPTPQPAIIMAIRSTPTLLNRPLISITAPRRPVRAVRRLT
jgi:hypothetical protein